MNPLPICVACKKQMECVQNNVPVKDAPVGDFPSTVWVGDKYKCGGCGAEIIAGFGQPLNEGAAEGRKSTTIQFER